MPATTRSQPSIQDIRLALQSPDHNVRAQATSDLLFRATHEDAIRPEALEIFRECLRSQQEPSTAISAARGLDLLASSEEARAAWLALLNDPRPHMVARTALHIQDPSYAPLLLEMLGRASNPSIRCALVNILGRLKYAPAYQSILASLNAPDTKTDAIMALGDLGNPEAIPYLEPHVEDNSQSHMTDDRGWPLRVGDLAAESVRQLQRASNPASTLTYQPAQRRWISIAPFTPLIAAGVELPWLAVVLFIGAFLAGSIPKNRAAVHLMDFIAMLPALAGLAVGALALVRGLVRTVVQWVCFVVGCAACGLIAFSFSWELFH
jgi:HEAT repeats